MSVLFLETVNKNTAAALETLLPVEETDRYALAVSPTRLRERIRVQIDETPFQCTVCYIEFKYDRDVMSHLRAHDNEIACGCGTCDKTFSGFGALLVHLRDHCGDQPVKCVVCGQTFARSRDLWKHNLRLHTEEKTKMFTCEVCDKKIISADKLKLHLRLHTGERPYECTVCGKKFNQSSDLKKHLRVHTGERPYGCKVCHKKFALSSNLTQHFHVHTGERSYGCTVCHKKFATSSNLILHLRVHTEERPYGCTVCHKKYKESGNLKKHLRVHSGVKPFKCVFCEEEFRSRCDLKYHVSSHHTDAQRLVSHAMCDSAASTHQGDDSSLPLGPTHNLVEDNHRDFPRARVEIANMELDFDLLSGGMSQDQPDPTNEQSSEQIMPPSRTLVTVQEITQSECTMRHMEYQHASDLETHQQPHLQDFSGNEAFLCEVCNMKFTTAKNFEIHMKHHSLKTPFGCEFCGRKLRTFADMLVHRRVHTRERPHRCQVCDKKFKTKGWLNRHLKKVHNKDSHLLCDVYKMQCGSSDSLEVYGDVHTEKESFESSVRQVTCSKSSYSETLALRHQCEGNWRPPTEPISRQIENNQDFSKERVNMALDMRARSRNQAEEDNNLHVVIKETPVETTSVKPSWMSQGQANEQIGATIPALWPSTSAEECEVFQEKFSFFEDFTPHLYVHNAETFFGAAVSSFVQSIKAAAR